MSASARKTYSSGIEMSIWWRWRDAGITGYLKLLTVPSNVAGSPNYEVNATLTTDLQSPEKTEAAPQARDGFECSFYTAVLRIGLGAY